MYNPLNFSEKARYLQTIDKIFFYYYYHLLATSDFINFSLKNKQGSFQIVVKGEWPVQGLQIERDDRMIRQQC